MVSECDFEKKILIELKDNNHMSLWEFYNKYFDKKMLTYDDLMKKIKNEVDEWY